MATPSSATPWARAVLAALLVAVAWAGLSAVAFVQPARAANVSVNQCNGTDNVGGQAVECTVTVTNHLDLATGDTTSAVTVRECHGVAGAPPTCTSSTVRSGNLLTSVTQCNGSGSGGGGTVTCSVHVTNIIVGRATATPGTVNQCIVSGQGGGTAPTTECNPLGSTTNADVTQCNSSGNGGGGTRRVRCTVAATESAALHVTINQCVGSGNGGGALVICDASIVNDIRAVTPTTPPASTASTTPRPSGSVRPSTSNRPTTSRTATATNTSTSTNTATATPLTASPTLPNTGTSSRAQLGTAGVLIVLGSGLLTLGRRRRGMGHHR